MSLLPAVVIGAEIAALLAILLYAGVLGSLHREAAHMQHEQPRADEISLSLQAAAKYGFRFGTLAVILGSIFLKGLT
jgi:hypothetical protein